jgi:endonuclease YncB( thermonuclease family)
MKTLLQFILAFSLVSLTVSCSADDPAIPKQIPDFFTGQVVRVADGDTFTVIFRSGDLTTEVRIRMNGIDAPEKDQPFGQKSKQALSGYIFGKNVDIIVRDTDRYGRTIADVFYEGDRGVSINERMVMDGWAWHYKYYSDDPALASHETTARQQRKGLWAGDSPIPPWNWRRGNGEPH